MKKIHWNSTKVIKYFKKIWPSVPIAVALIVDKFLENVIFQNTWNAIILPRHLTYFSYLEYFNWVCYETWQPCPKEKLVACWKVTTGCDLLWHKAIDSFHRGVVHSQIECMDLKKILKKILGFIGFFSGFFGFFRIFFYFFGFFSGLFWVYEDFMNKKLFKYWNRGVDQSQKTWTDFKSSKKILGFLGDFSDFSNFFSDFSNFFVGFTRIL